MALHTVKKITTILFFSASLAVLSCKGKQNDKDTNTNRADTVSVYDTSAATTTAPEIISEAQLKDATKDFPGVTATQENGEVTLTGTVSRDNLPTLMQSIQGLHPKKVNNNLTIK